jgi:hypothetical protein
MNKDAKTQLERQEYERLLEEGDVLTREKFEEIDEMNCIICLDKMLIGQTITKTKCGEQEYIPNTSSALKKDKKSILEGHKFHKHCLKEWFVNDKVYMTKDEMYFHRCPVCRGDVLNIVLKEEAEAAK